MSQNVILALALTLSIIITPIRNDFSTTNLSSLDTISI